MHARRRALLASLALALVATSLATASVTSAPPATALVSAAVPAVGTNDRAAVNALYRTYYEGATPAMSWTGAIGSCTPGTVSLDYQLAVLRRINYFRALAGVRADTALDASKVGIAQAAALMMSAANALSHNPDPATWPCASADGVAGAGSSNLALGVTGPTAIDVYMEDAGANNAPVGHRWWLLQPGATSWASGNVPASGTRMPANAVYVFGVSTATPWPAVRDPSTLVLWPPRGYVPRPHVPARWSVFDDQIDFTNASLTVTVDGVAVAVVAEVRSTDRLVWRFVNPLPAGAFDVRVVVTGATAGGVPTTIDYTSRAFVPADVLGQPPITPGPEYHPVVPERLLDTRPAGPQVGYAGAKPSAGQTVELQVPGAGTRGIPADAVAVALNVTVTEPAAAGFVTVWPCGSARPTASNVNVSAGQTQPNLVVVRTGAGGKVCLFTQTAAHLVADLAGWFPPGTTFAPTSVPERLLDTRAGSVTGYAGAKPAAGRTVELQVTGAGTGAVPSGASAAVLNVTVTEPSAATYVTVWPCGEPRPTASNLNAVAGQTVANLVIARIGAGGRVCLFTQSATHLVADLSGWFPAASAYVATTPVRLLDTRPATSVGGNPARLGAGQTRELAVAGAGAQPDGRAVVLNVTAVDASAAGYVTVWPCGSPRPLASNLNVTPGLVSANLVVAPIDATGTVCLFTSVPLDLVVDRNGDF